MESPALTLLYLGYSSRAANEGNFISGYVVPRIVAGLEASVTATSVVDREVLINSMFSSRQYICFFINMPTKMIGRG